MTNIKNKKAEYKNYSYYYSSPADILNSMKDVLKYFEIEVPDVKKGDSLKPKKPAKGDELKGPEIKTKPLKEESKKTEKAKEEKKDSKTHENIKDSKKEKDSKKSEL